MNKILKNMLVAALALSIILNLIALSILGNYKARFNIIEERLNMISNSISSIDSKVSNTIQPAKEEIQSDIMAPTELAEYLKIDIEKVYKLIIQNPNSKFPHLKIDGDVRFSKNAIDAYMLKGNTILE